MAPLRPSIVRRRRHALRPPPGSLPPIATMPRLRDRSSHAGFPQSPGVRRKRRMLVGWEQSQSPLWSMAPLPGEAAVVVAAAVPAPGVEAAAAVAHHSLKSDSSKRCPHSAAAVEAAAMVHAARRPAGPRLVGSVPAAAVRASAGQPRARRCRRRKTAQPVPRPSIRACFASGPCKPFSCRNAAPLRAMTMPPTCLRYAYCGASNQSPLELPAQQQQARAGLHGDGRDRQEP